LRTFPKSWRLVAYLYSERKHALQYDMLKHNLHRYITTPPADAKRPDSAFPRFEAVKKS
jgi:hypothetical protein